MKRLKSFFHHTLQAMENPRWILPLAIFSTLSLLVLSLTILTSPAFPFSLLPPSLSPAAVFVESNLHPLPASLIPPPPRLAYLVSGSAGDGPMLKRTLLALYHPHNRYVVHLEADSPLQERLDLESFVKNNTLFGKFGNVAMIKKANIVTYRGPTMVANTLHAAAVLLRTGGEWDWFINLSAKDYPLVTQDGGNQRAKPVIVDPGLYMAKKADILRVTQRRSLPTAFKLFGGRTEWNKLVILQRSSNIMHDVLEFWTRNGWRASLFINKVCDEALKEVEFPFQKGSYGFKIDATLVLPPEVKLSHCSAWMALSRPFIDYCVWGWDNLPRTILMYYANFISSPEGYFHTVICNAEEFRNTTVNSDLHFISWDNPPKQHPCYLTVDNMTKMVDSNAPFARKFRMNDPVLDKIDSELLFRGKDMVVPGGWCIGSRENGTDPCSVVGNITVIRPTGGAKRLENLISSLLSSEKFRPRQCK
ncbi:hypothetical protein RHSIM_Rhsim08G0064400 [Rhododendron simsii]|uniref:Uncharacterized protein n=1 Tax=Rhododendron simsii TaxID=118357 RepID=A0A834LD09_RHOSS|nr:hypothetical protein RHSIM_Rhsim08G0064400 [Rhododendron simsii]